MWAKVVPGSRAQRWIVETILGELGRITKAELGRELTTVGRPGQTIVVQGSTNISRAESAESAESAVLCGAKIQWPYVVSAHYSGPMSCRVQTHIVDNYTTVVPDSIALP